MKKTLVRLIAALFASMSFAVISINSATAADEEKPGRAADEAAATDTPGRAADEEKPGRAADDSGSATSAADEEKPGRSADDEEKPGRAADE